MGNRSPIPLPRRRCLIFRWAFARVVKLEDDAKLLIWPFLLLRPWCSVCVLLTADRPDRNYSDRGWGDRNQHWSFFCRPVALASFVTCKIVVSSLFDRPCCN